jgi:tetratricopeptide (TPR) repeat protein
LSASTAQSLKFLLLQDALRLQPGNVSALIGLGHLEIKFNHPDEAIRLLRDAVRLDPKAFEARFLLGTAYNSLKRYAEAAAEFQQALKLGGTDSQIYYHLARAYRALAREEESGKAMAQFSALHTKSDEEEEARREGARALEQSKALIDQGKLQEAIRLLEESRKSQRDAPQLLFRLAGLYYDTQQYDGARRDIRAAIELAPSEWTYHYLLGLIEKSTAHLEPARKSLETARRLNPSAAVVYNQLGDLAMARKNYAEAIRNFEQATGLDPNEGVYQSNLQSALRSRVVR